MNQHLYSGYRPAGRDPRRVRELGIHRGKSALVLGSGPSMAWCAEHVYRDVTIGVNTVGAHVHLDWLLLVDRPDTFGDRLQAIRECYASGVVVTNPYDPHWREHFPMAWSVLAIPIEHEDIPPPPWDHFHHGWVPMFNGAVYAACAFASYLGCTDIALGGADYTGDHSWSKPEKLEKLQRAFAALRTRIQLEGGHLWNASPQSRIETLPRCRASTN